MGVLPESDELTEDLESLSDPLLRLLPKERRGLLERRGDSGHSMLGFLSHSLSSDVDPANRLLSRFIASRHCTLIQTGTPFTEFPFILMNAMATWPIVWILVRSIALFRTSSTNFCLLKMVYVVFCSNFSCLPLHFSSSFNARKLSFIMKTSFRQSFVRVTSPVFLSRDMMTPSPISGNILSVFGRRSSFTRPVSDIRYSSGSLLSSGCRNLPSI